MDSQITDELVDDDEVVLQVTLGVTHGVDPLEAFNDFPERLAEFLATVPGVVSSEFQLWWAQSLSSGRILPQESYAVVVRVAEDDDDDGASDQP